jgi:hypothetical protein
MERVTAAESLIHKKRLTVERLGAAVVLRLKSLSMGRSSDSKRATAQCSTMPSIPPQCGYPCTADRRVACRWVFEAGKARESLCFGERRSRCCRLGASTVHRFLAAVALPSVRNGEGTLGRGPAAGAHDRGGGPGIARAGPDPAGDERYR